MSWETSGVWVNAARGIIGGTDEIAIRWRKPPSKGADGTAYRHTGGQRCLEINPDLSDKNKLFVLIHESCHHFLGHCEEVSTWAHQPSQSRVKTKPTRQYAQRETDTAKLTRRIQDYADQHADRYSGTWLERRLKALKFYRWQGLIDKAVKGAVDEALQKINVRR